MTTLVLKIGERNIELTLEEARELHAKLNQMWPPEQRYSRPPWYPPLDPPAVPWQPPTDIQPPMRRDWWCELHNDDMPMVMCQRFDFPKVNLDSYPSLSGIVGQK
jgi:hypothetical protein